MSGPSHDAWKYDKELAEIVRLPEGPEKERRRKDWARRLHHTFTTRRTTRPTLLRWHRVTGPDEP